MLDRTENIIFASPKKIFKWKIGKQKDISMHNVFKEIQIETTIRYHYIPNRMA
jgi:hypothetical protein